MNSAELEKRYRSKVRGWYERFEKLSNETDRLHTELERQAIEIKSQRKRIEKVVCENFEVLKELEQLRMKAEKMEFEHIELE